MFRCYAHNWSSPEYSCPTCFKDSHITFVSDGTSFKAPENKYNFTSEVTIYEAVNKKIQMIDKERYTKLLWFAAKHICNTDPAWSLSSPADVAEYLVREIDK